MALSAAMLVGGTALWFSRNSEERFFGGTGVVSGARGGSGARVWNQQELLEDPPCVAQLLRSEASNSTLEDRKLVWMFLRQECGAEGPGRSVDWFAADEAFTWLRGAEVAAPEIEAELMSLGGDQSLSEGLRCFALQHLGMWAEGHPLGARTVAQLRAATGEALAGGVGGLALRVLNRMKTSSAEEEWLRVRVSELLEAVDCPTEQRVAALQIAVELGAAEVEPFARKFVEPGRQVVERVNALLALGRLGNQETLRWLMSQPHPHEALVLEARERALLFLAKR